MLAQNYIKLSFFGQFKDHNSERKHRNRLMTPSFSSTFSTLTVFYQKYNQTYVEWAFFRFLYFLTSLILSNKATYFHKVAKSSQFNWNICLWTFSQATLMRKGASNKSKGLSVLVKMSLIFKNQTHFLCMFYARNGNYTICFT